MQLLWSPSNRPSLCAVLQGGGNGGNWNGGNGGNWNGGNNNPNNGGNWNGGNGGNWNGGNGGNWNGGNGGNWGNNPWNNPCACAGQVGDLLCPALTTQRSSGLAPV